LTVLSVTSVSATAEGEAPREASSYERFSGEERARQEKDVVRKKIHFYNPNRFAILRPTGACPNICLDDDDDDDNVPPALPFLPPPVLHSSLVGSRRSNSLLLDPRES
jgi:hypothetical protein